MSDREVVHVINGETPPPDAPSSVPSQPVILSEASGSNYQTGSQLQIGPGNLEMPSRFLLRMENGGVATGFETAKIAPPWLVSLFIHMAVMIILGLFALPKVIDSTLELDVAFTPQLADNLKEDVTLSTTIDETFEQSYLPQNDLLEVDDPLVTPLELPVAPVSSSPKSKFETNNIGIALNGREPGMKDVLLMAYGGDAATESAVKVGLEWLKKNQRLDGTWSLRGPYSSGAHVEDVTSATAMALLAFQGAGHTHLTGEYKSVVQKGWQALSRMQGENGDFWQGKIRHYRLYSQAQATIAVCELYGMTEDSRFRLLAQNAVDYAVKIQDDLGGWRYQPGNESDLSVTGWFVMGLQSARMAGLTVPYQTWQRVEKFLDLVAASGGSTYRYQPNREVSYPMTAEGLLCRQYLGWQKSDQRMVIGIKYLTTLPIQWEDKNVYYWYYATQVMHHFGDDAWEDWNQEMKKVIPKRQTQSGPEKGSWSPTGDQWGSQGGRLYTTCLCIYMLEVYYRHLPIYESMYQ